MMLSNAGVPGRLAACQSIEDTSRGSGNVARAHHPGTDSMILAGDIGGTKAELGLFDSADNVRQPRFERKLKTREFPSLEALVNEFLKSAGGHPQRAVFGIAGPVRDNRCDATNLPWHMDGDGLGRSLGIEVTLLNDLSTTGWGLSTLGPDDFA